MWTKKSNTNPEDIYYSVLRLNANGMDALRFMFPTGDANSENVVLFSTSGVHGDYSLIEDVEATLLSGQPGELNTVTFVIVQPRIVCMRYGNAEPKTIDDIDFLKRLRASSLQALATVGMPWT